MSNLHLQPVNERQGRRYSYLNTPAEYQVPTFPPRNPDKPDNAVGPPIQSDRVSSPGPQNPYAFSYTVTGANSPPPQTTAHTVPYIQPQMNPTPPPLSEHPARFAPYADSPTSPTRQTQQPQQPQQLQYHSPSPASPGPIPPKQMLQPDMQQQRPPQKEYSVAPDSNPLAPPDPGLTPKPSSISAAGSQLGTRTTARDLNHAPGQVLHPRQEVRGGTWSYALCDCRDIGVCCTGLFCPCILYGRTQYRLSRKSDQKDPTNLLGYETCNAQCTAMGLLCGCQCTLWGCSLSYFHKRCIKPLADLSSEHCRAFSNHSTYPCSTSIWYLQRYSNRLRESILLYMLHTYPRRARNQISGRGRTAYWRCAWEHGSRLYDPRSNDIQSSAPMKQTFR
ncbi:conserved hypothetical protein [Coccidioides posadasii str. Silveira]|uniref:Uncharacterized protein n=1 Tax=Coccidioides posadasii (strain RMSCC 757 / Silveira) TaxID=443226 RepID=E9D2Y8_COCPS|nr:conserved hypothetical protein [Coccidioides posadasii str. Silveira]